MLYKVPQQSVDTNIALAVFGNSTLIYSQRNLVTGYRQVVDAVVLLHQPLGIRYWELS